MTRIRIRGEKIRRFILDQVPSYPADIGRMASEHFKISRQAVNKHLQRLTKEGALSETGKTRNREYKLRELVTWGKKFEIASGIDEDQVWTQEISKFLGPQAENVTDIWHYAFTEMFNNAIDHSGGEVIRVVGRKTATTTEILLIDDGIGIFKKIQQALGLMEERHAVLELAKGKLTTDPKRHTGEGIFFTSRVLDSFNIYSGEVAFSHDFGEEEDWIFEKGATSGTTVWMKLNNHTARTAKKVFDKYVTGDDYGFTKTVVPVKLAQYDKDKLISRSQAKRVLARVELFKTVLFDFNGVPMIGQAFADEIFRVFRNAHPEISIVPIRTNTEVKRMISRTAASDATEELPFPDESVTPNDL